MGVYSRFTERQTDNTNRNKNIAIFYASYRTLNSLLPNHKEVWDKMLESVGLDPSDNSEDPNTLIGIGNIAGNSVVVNREHDGMNQLGDEGGRTYNREP
ncbi:MAG: DUF6851 domain-containing protein [Gammaproteobacteria bacterium]